MSANNRRGDEKAEIIKRRIALHERAVLFHLSEHMPSGIIKDYRTCSHVACLKNKADVDELKAIEMGVNQGGS
jgi:hypothetical protein